ncbi:hypothetical protein D3C72_2445140 [compost metagenome]
MHEFILHGVQPGFGALAFVHFARQLLVHVQQLGRAFVHQRRQLRLDGRMLFGALAMALASDQHDAERGGQQA